MKSKEEPREKKKTWRTQDWIWLLAVIIYAQGLVFLHNELLMQAISYVSTFVSIALAGIAIYISIKEATNNDNLKKEIYVILEEMRSKIGDLNTKMDSFNPSELQKINKEEIDDMKELLVSDMKQVVTQIREEQGNAEEIINKLIKEKVNENTEKLIFNLNEEQNKYLNNKLSIKNNIDPVRQVLFSYDVGAEFTLSKFKMDLEELTGKHFVRGYVLKRLLKFVDMGYLIQKGDEFLRLR